MEQRESRGGAGRLEEQEKREGKAVNESQRKSARAFNSHRSVDCLCYRRQRRVFGKKE